MKVVYIFTSKGSGICHLIQKVLPQLEDGRHYFEVVGMCFFDSNALILQLNNSFGLRLAVIAKEKNIILMTAESKDFTNFLEMDDQYNNVKSNFKRKPTECAVITVVDGIEVGCFPHLHAALAGNLPDHVICI